VIFPVILDSRAKFLRGEAANASLLLAHLGTRTLLEHIASRLDRFSQAAPTVVAGFDLEASYVAKLRDVLPGLRAVVGTRDFRDWLAGCEPSDFLLLVDPRCFPVDVLEEADLVFRHPAADPRWARHLVALDLSPAGTRERVDLDGSGRVRRIQRYYEAVTWPFASGVACSLLPVSCGLVAGELSFNSLGGLRRALNAAGVPSRDLPLSGAALDLTREEGLLKLNEGLVLGAFASRPASEPLCVGDGQVLHASARFVGPVVLHAGARVDADAVVVGPTVLGPRARVGSGALVAQSLLAADTQVPPRWTIRHRALFERLPVEPPLLRDAGPSLYRGPGVVAELKLEAGPAVPRGLYLRLKPFLEIPLALLALLLLSPLLLVVALLVRLDSRGPALYGHKREGKDGRPFTCWKFRTMFDGAEAQERVLLAANQVDGPQFKMDKDPRITRVGHWIRPSSIDELPQLVNVALGQMSLVGPRPSPFRENQLCVPWREGRLSVRPGITGLWQVCRHDRQAGDFHQWIQFDLLYVRHASFPVDLKVALATLWTGGGRTNVPLDWIIPAAAAAAPLVGPNAGRPGSEEPMARAS